MLVEQQPAYILHRRQWRETSLLLECLTRDYGRIGLVVRGARRARSRLPAVELQPFRSLLVSFSIKGDLGTLRQVESGRDTIFSLEGISLLSGFYVNELIIRLSQRMESLPQLFDIYQQTLVALANTSSLAWSLRQFECNFLTIIGYAMELEQEAQSGQPLQPDAYYFYIPEYGPVLAHGGQGLRIKGADLISLADNVCPDPQALMRLKHLFRGVIKHYLGGKSLQSWRVLSRLPASKSG